MTKVVVWSNTCNFLSFALDPVVLIEKNHLKKMSLGLSIWFWTWSACVLDPVIVIFFKDDKKSVSLIKLLYFFLNAFDPLLMILLVMIFFSFLNNDWIRLTIVFFYIFWKKKYNNWIKCKLSMSRTKWTGLKELQASPQKSTSKI